MLCKKNAVFELIQLLERSGVEWQERFSSTSCWGWRGKGGGEKVRNGAIISGQVLSSLSVSAAPLPFPWTRMPCRATCHSRPSLRLAHMRVARRGGHRSIFNTRPFETTLTREACSRGENSGHVNWLSRRKCARMCTRAHKRHRWLQTLDTQTRPDESSPSWLWKKNEKEQVGENLSVGRSQREQRMKEEIEIHYSCEDQRVRSCWWWYELMQCCWRSRRRQSSIRCHLRFSRFSRRFELNSNAKKKKPYDALFCCLCFNAV